MSSLIDNKWIFNLLLHSVYCNTLLWLKHEDYDVYEVYLTAYRYTAEKKELCFNRIFRCYDATKLDKWYLLKDELQCRIWNHTNKFFVFDCIKSIGYFIFWVDLFIHVWFYNTVYWSFGKYWFTKRHSSSTCWHISLHNMKKKMFINITMDLFRRISKYWKTVKLMKADLSFPTF